MRALTLLVGVLLSACSSQDDLGSGNGQCAERKGTYRSDWTENSGDCGPVDSTVDTIEEQPPSGPVEGCSGYGIGYTTDNCEVVNKYVCPLDNGYSFSMDGRFLWSRDASRGEGNAHVMILDGNRIACESDYTIRMTRQ